MKKLMLCLSLLFGGFLFTGCGGGGQDTNVADSADAEAIADYEAEEKARAAAMQATPPTE